MKRITKLISIALLFYGVYAVSADIPREAAGEYNDDSKEEKTIDDTLAERFGNKTIVDMIEHMSRDPKANYGAHVIPIAKVLFRGLPIRVLSVATTFEDGASRMQIGRRITVDDARNGMWSNAILSRNGQMGIERPLRSFLEQPLSPQGIIGSRFMNKERRRLGVKYGHAMLFYEFPNPINFDELEYDRELAQNQFAQVKALNDWLLRMNSDNFIKANDPRSMHNRDNLVDPAKHLTAEQRVEGLGLISAIEGIAPVLYFTKPYMAFVGELKGALQSELSEVSAETVQVAHKQYCDRFGKFGLHASKMPTDDQINGYLRLRGYGDRLGESRENRLALLGWKVKNGNEEKAEAINTEALMDGQGAINFPAIAGLDWLFKHMHQLETQERLRGNREFKAHKAPTALLPVLIHTRGIYEIAHVPLHAGNLGDVFQQWKADAELRNKLKPATLLEERYALELEKALVRQKLNETLPLGTPITPSRYLTQCLNVLAEGILREHPGAVRSAEDVVQLEKEIRIKAINETLRMEGRLSDSQLLTKYFDLRVINTDAPLGSAFQKFVEDSVMLDSSDEWFLAEQGQSFSREAVDELIEAQGDPFRNPETQAVTTRASLCPNNVMARLITRVAAACTASIGAGEPELSEMELAAAMNSVLNDNCGDRLAFFDKNPEISRAITMRQNFPAQGLVVGNTYPQQYVAGQFCPRWAVEAAIEKFKKDHANDFYPNLRLNGFIGEQQQLLSSAPAEVAVRAPRAEPRGRALDVPVMPRVDPSIPAWIAEIEDPELKRELLQSLGIHGVRF